MEAASMLLFMQYPGYSTSFQSSQPFYFEIPRGQSAGEEYWIRRDVMLTTTIERRVINRGRRSADVGNGLFSRLGLLLDIVFGSMSNPGVP